MHFFFNVCLCRSITPDYENFNVANSTLLNWVWVYMHWYVRARTFTNPLKKVTLIYHLVYMYMLIVVCTLAILNWFLFLLTLCFWFYFIFLHFCVCVCEYFFTAITHFDFMFLFMWASSQCNFGFLISASQQLTLCYKLYVTIEYKRHCCQIAKSP